jgi:CRISPR-associated protein Csb2
MPLAITVRLRHGRYDAGTGPGRGAEWPPHPARVFCALAASLSVSGAAEPGLAALRWLESQPPPKVWADPQSAVHFGRSGTHVPENAILSMAKMTPPANPNSSRKAKKSGLQWPARSNGMRSRAYAVPATACFVIVWPQAEPAPEVLSRLTALAAGVPYVGRSTSLAEVSVLAGLPDRLPGWVTFEPASLDARGETWLLNAPYPGYTDALEAACQEGRRACEISRPLLYCRAPAAVLASAPISAAAPAEGPFEDLMVWRLARPDRGLDGGQAVLLASALRRAVLARVADPLPAQLSGHGADDKPHVGFTVIPDVGHSHADGHILGVALAIPRALSPADLAQLLKGVLVTPLTELHLPGAHLVTLEYGASRYGLRPERWTGPRSGARTWVTATPIMLDGYLRRGRTEAGEVARALCRAGYPEPEVEEVEVSPAPLISGAPWRPRASTLPPGRNRYPVIHARVTFPVPVVGPVIAGSMRYLGLGLFLPLPPRLPARAAGHQPAAEPAGLVTA